MSKQQSLIIRGIAILLMIAYHLYDICDSYTSLLYIGGKPFIYYINNMASPVSFFVLLSGYGLSVKAYSASFKEKIIKILKLYIVYWIVMIIFPLIIGPYMNPSKYPGDILNILYNVIGYKWTYSVHNWFLLPYVILYLLSDIVNKFIDRKGKVISLLVSMMLSFLSAFMISKYRISNLGQLLFICTCVVTLLFPFVFGAIMERLNREGVLVCKKLVSPMAIALLISIVVLRSLFHTHALNSFFAIVVVYLIIHFEFEKHLEKILIQFGKYSMPMWFIHGYLMVYLFRDFFCQLKYPLLIYIAVVCISYILSIPIMKFGDIISKKFIQV